MVWVIYLKGFSSRFIIEIYLINVFDDDDGYDDILNFYNFLSYDRYKNRYYFRELNVFVKLFWNVVNYFNWVRFVFRNFNCLCFLIFLLIKFIVID